MAGKLYDDEDICDEVSQMFSEFEGQLNLDEVRIHLTVREPFLKLPGWNIRYVELEEEPMEDEQLIP
jgi:hypothetical protein